MKITPVRNLVQFLLFVAATGTFAVSANGQVYLAFSGGSGSPISMTVASPIHYTINATPTSSAPLFLFQQVGSMFYLPGGTEVSLTGSLRYSVNGVGDYPITNISSGIIGGDVNFSDTLLSWSSVAGTAVAPGDVVTLSSGTVTTDQSLAAAAPENGFYQSFLVDGVANRVSDNAIPEPSAYALAAGLTCVGLAVLARRRKTITSPRR